jgi:hypothetical protein
MKKNPHRFAFTSLVLLALLASLFATSQEARASKPYKFQDRKPLPVQPTPSPEKAARKFDEFGDVQWSDLIARLDNFAIALQNEPTTKGFVVIYRGRRDLPAFASRKGEMIKAYMTNNRQVSKDGLVIIDGGILSSLTYELWIVPVGATPVIRSDSITPQLYSDDEPTLIDVGTFSLKRDEVLEDGMYLNGPAGKSKFFGDTIRNHPTSRAYIVGYGEYRTDTWSEYNTRGIPIRTRHRLHQDRIAEVQNAISNAKRDLVKEFGIDPVRIVTVFGGYRTSRAIELWLVPRAAHPPITTPTKFPKRGRQSRESNPNYPTKSS